MYISIVAFIIFLIFSLLMGFVFLVPMIVVFVNALILYCLTLRISTDINKSKQGELYLISGVAAALMLLIFGNFLPLWRVTSIAILTYIIARIYNRLSN